MGTLSAFSPGPRAFVEGYRPPHPGAGTAHAGRLAVRQNLCARLHGDAPWRRVCLIPSGRVQETHYSILRVIVSMEDDPSWLDC